MKERLENRINKEIETIKEKKFSKKRTIIIFSVILFWIISLMIVWGGLIHKNTGISPDDFELQEDDILLDI